MPLQPVDAKAALGVYLALLSLVVIIDRLVDSGERVADGDRLAADCVDAAVA